MRPVKPMAENSGIEWTHHTFNPWIGCTNVSPGCDYCYAEALMRRFGRGDLWEGHRRRTKTWGDPVRWNRKCGELGIRQRVFCASLADVFDNQAAPSWRIELFGLIRNTPHLDWLLLTKRPQNIAKMLPLDWGEGWPNVWLGTTVENQEEADRRIPHLLCVPARVRFLSCEPLLGPVDLEPWVMRLDDLASAIDWVITGGESGPNYRHADPDWFRSLRDQCAAADVPFLFKQWEGKTQPQIKALGRELDGVVHDAYPRASVERDK